MLWHRGGLVRQGGQDDEKRPLEPNVYVQRQRLPELQEQQQMNMCHFGRLYKNSMSYVITT